jgi:hypothetical protein
MAVRPETLLVEHRRQGVELALVPFHEGEAAPLQDAGPAFASDPQAARSADPPQAAGQVGDQLLEVQEQPAGRALRDGLRRREKNMAALLVG